MAGDGYRVGVLGATGLVGTKMLEVLKERNFPVTELIPVASEKSVGKKLVFKNREWAVVSATDAIQAKPAIAIFSAGGATSLEWAPKFAAAGITVIDNSSAWRMDPYKKLVVPEINADALGAEDKIIANPNCSTIQMVVALKPIYDAVGIERINVATYQSVSGAGAKAVRELADQTAQLLNGRPIEPKVFPKQIGFNCLPQIDRYMDNGYTKEEMKMENEGRKIMHHHTFRASVTCVRVPVYRSHSVAVNAEFEKPVTVEAARAVLKKAPGLDLNDEPENKKYPMPLFTSEKYNCEVGRIRMDCALDNGLAFWVCGDQLLKGAALNAVQIAEELVK